MAHAVPTSRTGLDRIEIYFADLTSAQAALDEAERQTPRLSRDQIERYQNRASHNREDAGLWRLAHIALRIALERHVGDDVRGVPYAIEAGGRPRLLQGAGSPTMPFFSLSHAGSYALIAISLIGPIGVDLEVSRELNLKVERRLRIENAAAHLAPNTPLPSEPDERFLQSWVRLEAAAKASGAGIGRLLTAAGAIGGASPQPAISLGYSGTVRDIDLEAGYFAAIAAAELPPILTVGVFPANAAALVRFANPSAGQ